LNFGLVCGEEAGLFQVVREFGHVAKHVLVADRYGLARSQTLRAIRVRNHQILERAILRKQ